MTAETVTRSLGTESEMEALGAELANGLVAGLVIQLSGNLGAGKTTLVRGLLRARGYAGAVKSPTYTLVEPYEMVRPPIYHFDLYRLRESEELEFIGWRDYLERGAVCLIEWPERGRGKLPVPDIEIKIEQVGPGRQVKLIAHTSQGLKPLAGIT